MGAHPYHLRMDPDELAAEAAARHRYVTRDRITMRDPATLADFASWMTDEALNGEFAALAIRAGLYPTDEEREAFRQRIDTLAQSYAEWLAREKPDHYGDLLADGPDRDDER